MVPSSSTSNSERCTGGLARAAEVELVVRKLLAADAPPDLIVYGLSPRQLLDKSRPRNSAYLWDLAGWWDERRVRGSVIDEFLPQVLRNELVRCAHAYRYREEIGAAFATRTSEDFWESLGTELTRRDTPLSPMRGELAVWQRIRPSISLKVSAAHVQRYVDRVWTAGKWSMERQERKLGAILTRCREAGVPLVLFGRCRALPSFSSTSRRAPTAATASLSGGRRRPTAFPS